MPSVVLLMFRRFSLAPASPSCAGPRPEATKARQRWRSPRSARALRSCANLAYQQGWSQTMGVATIMIHTSGIGTARAGCGINQRHSEQESAQAYLELDGAVGGRSRGNSSAHWCRWTSLEREVAG
jgi:hypothetical protein